MRGDAVAEAALKNMSIRPTGYWATVRQLISKQGQVLQLAGSLFLLFAIAVPLAWKMNIWTDEAFTLHTTSGSVGYAFRQAANFELQPPVYFVLLKLWRGIDDSIFFARLFSILCAGAAVVVAWLISKRVLAAISPGWLTLFLAIHPFVIWVATEIRVYALVLLLSSLLIYLFIEGFCGEKICPAFIAVYLAVAVISLYTFYYLGFLLAANACALVALRKLRVLGLYLSVMIFVGILFLPGAVMLMRQFNSAPSPASGLSLLRALDETAWQVKDFLAPAGGPIALTIRKWFLRLSLLGVVLVLLRNWRSALQGQFPGMVAIGLVTGAFFIAALTVVTEGLLIARHMAPLLLPVTLLFFSLTAFIEQRKIRVAILVMLLMFAVSSTYSRFKTWAKPGSWDKVAGFIEQNEQPAQPIAVFHAGATLPLSYYYHGRNRLIAIPRENSWERFDLQGYVLKNEADISNALNPYNGSGRFIWLVTDNQCSYAGVNYNCEMLEEFFKRNYVLERTQTFGTATVRLFEKNRGMPGPAIP
jgi:hypothetical protein